MQEALSWSYYCFGPVCFFLTLILTFLLGISLFLHRKYVYVIVFFVGSPTMIHNREFEKMLISFRLTERTSPYLQMRKC